MRVLLIAPGCSPGNSEPMMGFQLTRSLSKYVDVVVATHRFFQRSIEDAGGLGRAEPVYLDLENLVRKTGNLTRRLKLASSGGTLLNYPQEIVFERELWRLFRHDLTAGRFDLVHRVTPQSSALPSPLASLSPVPFVIGPVNGGLRYPKEFRREMWKEREWLRYIRWFYRFLPYVRSTYRKSAAILASGQHTIDALPINDPRKTFNLMEIGFDPTTFQVPDTRPSHDRLTFLFVGRLVPFKCARIAIDAFGGSPLLRRHRFLIVGDGPERDALEEQVKSLGLEETVTLLGLCPTSEVAALMRSADVFVFPSIRESGGLVVAEAMASGLVCVVTDYGGPGNIVTHDTGIKIPLSGPEELTIQFRRKLEEVARDEPLRIRLSAAAADRIFESFTWDSKAKIIHEVYRWVLGQRPDKPDPDQILRDEKRELREQAI